VRVVGHNIHRPRLDFREDACVEIFDLERHEPMLANALTRRKPERAFVTPNVLASRRAATDVRKKNTRAGGSG
jgi:hypothetical protein